VGVQIYEARQKPQTIAIDNFIALQVATDLANATIRN
jgi:hypothetical protein